MVPPSIPLPPAGCSLRALSAAKSLLSAVAWGSGVFTLLFALAAIVAAVVLLRRKTRPARSLPPISILKPLKGLDPDLYENLAGFCRLDYPETQIILTLSRSDDPAYPVAVRLRDDFPNLDITIAVSDNRIGYNPKINNLSNATPFIKHGILLISDSDVRVDPNFLRRMVAPLEDPKVGLVTSFYRSTHPRGFWAHIETLSVNAHFMPQAIFAAACGYRFAMGAAMLVRRDALDRAGGFAFMAQHLADDFILGDALLKAGHKIAIADGSVESLPAEQGLREQFRHQTRWARTIRLCRPSGYLGLGLTQGFSWITLSLLFSGFDPALPALAGLILLAKAATQGVNARLLGPGSTRGAILLLPLSEWIAFGAWVAGFWSSPVLWRGEFYSIGSRGRLTPLRSGLEAGSAVLRG